MTPTQDADEDFEFLVNLLASDGADHDTPPLVTGSKRADRGLRIQRGSDGRLDLGQVKAFYENKNMGVRTAGEKDGPGVMDRSRIPSGKGEGDVRMALEGDITVSRSVSERDDQTGSPSSEPLTPVSDGTDQDFPDDFQERAQASVSSPSTDDPGRWVDLLSEREAKQLLFEISDALKLKLPLENDSSSSHDQPRTLGEVKKVVDFLVTMDELVWRRSEYGANRGVFDSKNISAVEERIRLWEKIARGDSSE